MLGRERESCSAQTQDAIDEEGNGKSPSSTISLEDFVALLLLCLERITLRGSKYVEDVL